MQVFKLKMIENFNPPVVDLYDYSVMIDTGANIPVFYLPEDVVQNEFHGKLLGNAPLSGATGRNIITRVYRIDCFQIGKLYLKNIPIMVVDLDKDISMPADILLGSCVFGNDTKLNIDYCNRTVSCDMSQTSVNAGCLWHFHNGKWRVLDYSEHSGIWLLK